MLCWIGVLRLGEGDSLCKELCGTVREELLEGWQGPAIREWNQYEVVVTCPQHEPQLKHGQQGYCLLDMFQLWFML